MLAIPGQVIAGYLTVTITLIFALGMRMIVSDGLDRRQALVVGVSFWIGAGGEENIEDRLALLGKGAAESSLERDVSLRLLRHLATEVRHRQYYDTDFIRIRVAPKV